MDNIKISSGGRKERLYDRTGFQELYLFMWKLTKPAEKKYESGDSVCCGLVAEDCHTQCTYSLCIWAFAKCLIQN